MFTIIFTDDYFILSIFANECLEMSLTVLGNWRTSRRPRHIWTRRTNGKFDYSYCFDIRYIHYV